MTQVRILAGLLIIQICKTNLDYSNFSRMRTVCLESREKGLLVNNYKIKKVLSRVGGAILAGSLWGEVGSNATSPPANLEELPQNKLKEIIKTVSKIRETKYSRRRIKKYGNLNKGFTEEELKKRNCYLAPRFTRELYSFK